VLTGPLILHLGRHQAWEDSMWTLCIWCRALRNLQKPISFFIPSWSKSMLKVGSHDENCRSPWYWFLYQGTRVSTGKKIQNNTGLRREVALVVRRPRTSMSFLVRSKSYEVSINFVIAAVPPRPLYIIISSIIIIIIIYYYYCYCSSIFIIT